MRRGEYLSRRDSVRMARRFSASGMRGRPQGRFSTARWQISDCGLQIPSARRRRVRPGRSRSPGGLGFRGDWGCCPDAQNHGVAIASFPSLRAGPEGLRRFRQSSLTKLVDIPNGLCYLSWRNGNHANASAAHGHQGVRNGRNDEKRIKSDPRDRIKSDHIQPNPTKSDQKKWTSPDQGAGRWIKTGTDEPRFGSSSLDTRKL